MANTKTAHRTKTEIKYPNLYRVDIYNDDQTPVEFVIQMLIEIFNKDINTAKEITMDIHNKGKSSAGVYSLEIAEQKVTESLHLCKLYGYPLKIVAERI
jgi:ATP-dependent Clp protease adaptor protein ClpS